jgi:pilus assembly protein FimV
MAIPTAPPHPLKISVSTTLCALALLAAPAGTRAAVPAEDGPRVPYVLAQAAAQPAATKGKQSAQSSEDAAITATVRAWAQAWAGQDVERYLGFYSPTFKPGDGMTRKAWESQRRSRVKSPRSIVVTVDDVELTRPDATHATVKFRQTYESDRYRDQVGKTLDLVHEGDRWLIVKEEAAPVVPKTAAAAAAEKKAPAAPLAPSLGELRVLSNLGQRFHAEIELGALQHVRKDDLNVRLAPVDAYRQAGIVFNPVLVGAKATVEERDGKPFAVVITRERVQEPFLDLLVEVESKSGRLVRKYTALLDPPTYIPPPPAGAVVGPTPTAAETARPPAPKAAAQVKPPRAPKPSAPVSPPRAPKPAAPVSPPPAPAPGAKAPPAVAGTEYRVRAGDTLARIAGKHVQEGVTLDQMLVALYRANPDAFINGDINLLSAGSVLKIPDRATATALEPAQAEQTARALMSGAKEHGGVIAAKAPTVSPPATKPAGRAQGAAPAPESRVKLSRAEPGKPVTPSAAAAGADDRAARERALKEAMSRVEELEKTVADLQKLIQIRNEQIADLEQRIATMKSTAAAPAPKPAAEAPKPAIAPPKPAAEAPKPAATAPKPAVEAPKPAAQAPKPAPVAPKPAPEAPKPVAEAPKPAPAPPKPKPAPTPPKPRPAAQPAPEPSLIDEYLGDPYMTGGLAGVFVLLVAYGVYAWRKKKRALRSQLSESLLGAAAGAPAMQTAAAAAQGAAAAPGGGEDADPLEEADVYMTYGRDAQAEEILREAIRQGETRPLAYSMLLQIYAKRRDTEKFESTVLKMRGLVGGEGADWEKAMALGRSIDPGNSLYGQGEATEVTPAAEAAEEHEVDFDLDAISGAPAVEGAKAGAPEAQPVDFNIDATTSGMDKPSEVDMTIDFDLGGVTAEMPAQTGAGAPAAPGQPAETAPGSDVIDFDLGGVTTEMPAQSGAAAPAEGKPPQTGGIPPLELSLEGESAPAAGAAPDEGAGAAADLDLSLEPESGQAPQPHPAAASPPPPAAAPPAGAPDLSGISLDLSVTDSGGGGGDARLQEVATKLHLAKSFEEIGDHDAARELLDEVIKEGDSAQQAQAQKMLASLG